MVKKFAAALTALSALLAISACSKNIKNEDAVRQAIVDHLGKRGDLNLSTMNVQVTNVEYGTSNDAVATVSFAPKGEGGGGMSMRYHLVQEGGQWVVKGKKDSGGMGAHGSGMGTMPAPAPEGGGSDLPPGHPPVSPPKK
jgi:hypothetical protein